MKKIIIAFVILLLAAGGGYWYGQGQKAVTKPLFDGAKTASSEAVTNASIEGWQECSNPSNHFTIKYPPAWVTLTSSAIACSYFNPTALPNPPAGALITVAGQQKADQLVSVAKDKQTSNEEQLLLSKRDLEIKGLSMTKIETEATGVGKGIKGTVTVTYLIPHGDYSLILTYNEAQIPADRQNLISTLEQMLTTLSVN